MRSLCVTSWVQLPWMQSMSRHVHQSGAISGNTQLRAMKRKRERKKASLLINSLLCFPRVVMIFCSICSGLFDVAVRLAKLEPDAV